MLSKFLTGFMMLLSLTAKSTEPEFNKVKEITDPRFYSAKTMTADEINRFYNDKLPPEMFDIWSDKKSRTYLHGAWKFIKLSNTREAPNCDYGENNNFHEPDFDDSKWFNQPVPYLWHNPFTTGYEKNSMIRPIWGGVGWYRRTFTVPNDLGKKRLILYCRMIDNQSTIYVNGKKVCVHNNFQYDCFWASFHFARSNNFEVDITEFIKPGMENSLAIRVYDDSKNTSGSRAPDCPGWGGIWQEIFLEVRPEIYLRQALITPRLNKSAIEVKAFITNTDKLARQISLKALLGPWESKRYKLAKGKTETYSVGDFKLEPGKTILDFQIQLDKPVKWTTEFPYLYLFKLEDNNGNVLGQERFGFRDFTTGSHLFKLNGVDIYLMGRQIDPFTYECNYSLSSMNRTNGVWDYLKTIKNANYNFGRFHSTFAPNCFYQIADELGLLVYDEIPRTGESGGGVSNINNMDVFYNVKKDELTPENRKNLKERLHVLYNHPSVAIRSGGNEIWDSQLQKHPLFKELKSFVPYLDKVTAEFWKYDRTRPVTPCSGRAPTDASLIKVGAKTWAQAFGKPANGDFYDIHKYSWYPPLEVDEEESFSTNFKGIYNAYALDKGQPGVVLNGETGGTVIPLAGHSYNQRLLKFFDGRLINGKFDKRWFVDTFKDPLNKIPGSLGGYSSRKECFFHELATNKTVRLANARHIKRLYEMYRRQRRWMGGFVNCYVRLFENSNSRKTGQLKINQPADAYIKASLQPLLACFDGKLNRNLIVGKVYPEKVWVMNDYLEKMDKLTVEISLEKDGKTVHEFPELKVGALNPAELKEFPFEFTLPVDFKTGHYQGRLNILVDGKVKSDNWTNYDFYILNPSEVNVAASAKAVVYSPADLANDQGLKALETILKELKIPYRKLGDLDKMTGDGVLFLPPQSWKQNATGAPFLKWLNAGGRVVCFQQQNMPFGISGRIGSCRRAGYQSEILDPDYPLFKGLKYYDFYMWNGKRDNIMNKWFVSSVILPLTYAGQAVVQPDNFRLGMSIAEMRIGKGLCLMTQLEALQRFNSDSVATRYLVNLFNYVLGEWDGQYACDVELSEDSSDKLEFDRSKAFFVNLQPHANMGFKDDVARDKKGGWTDQGKQKDMRNIPTGKLSLRGVDFNIINPAESNGKSCLVLRGGRSSHTEFLPKAIEQIHIGRKVKKLYLLMAGAWVPATVEKKIAEMEVVYGQGTGAQQVLFSKLSFDIISGKNIRDWGNSLHDKLPDAVSGWVGPMGENKMNEVATYIIEWINPEPNRKVNYINFKSQGIAVPILIAITGEELK